MADSTLDAACDTASNDKHGHWGPYWTDDTTGVYIYLDSSNDPAAKKTTDGGASLSVKATSESIAGMRLAAWFDRQTPGDLTGTKVHVVCPDDAGNTLRYNYYDIAAGAWGTAVTVFSISVATNNSSNFCGIGKTRSGYLYAWCFVGATAGDFAVSTDGGATWDATIASPYETDNDQAIAVACNTGDGNDFAMVYDDSSADELSIKIYDHSANTWSEAVFKTGITENNTEKNYDASTFLSDGRVFLTMWHARATAGADLLAWILNINAATAAAGMATAKTDVLTDTNNANSCSVFIDQQRDHVYVSYHKGTAFGSLQKCFYKKSTDYGATWGSETPYSEAAEANLKGIGATAMSKTRGRFQPIFYDDGPNDTFYNQVNDLVFDATTAPALGQSQMALRGVG